ncbi:MAG: T9SS type A sorting domain-containing protein [Bacteroidia bacterium]|nr:T9SS type A sorting domain-containing protein [Bacteroidia bacterium]
MKKLSFIIILFSIATRSFSQTATIRGMYVDGFSTILGNVQQEDSLLNYAQDNSFNYLALYDLWPVHVAHNLTNTSSSAILANFIQKAKQQYNILQLGAVGENYFFFNNVINVYNQQHSNPLQKFDVYNVEFEFWNTTTVSSGNYYCTTYLQPGAYSCDTSGAFAYYKTLIRQVDSLANANGVMSELYVGWFNQGQAIAIGNSIDRILLHDYISNYSGIYSYVRTRLQYLAARNILTQVIPIFSAEPSFMGPWLNSNPIQQAYNDVATGLSNETGSWKQYIDLKGYQWFAYSFMPPSPVLTGIDDTQAENITVYPNPSTGNISIQLKESNDHKVILYNMFGQKMHESEYKQTEMIHIDIHHLSAGTYLCRIQTGDQLITKRILITK